MTRNPYYFHPHYFQWRVHRGVYRWVDTYYADEDTSSLPTRFLTDGLGWSDSELQGESYEPLKEEALFMKFQELGSDLESDEDRILAFANQFGPLGGRVQNTISFWKGQVGTLFWGESLNAWRQEIKLMKNTATLWMKWRLLDTEWQLPDTIGLRDLLDGWNGPFDPVNDEEAAAVFTDLIYEISDGRKLLPAPSRDKLIRYYRTEFKDDVRRYAFYVVAAVVSGQIEKLATPTVIANEEAQKFECLIVPKCLLGALWIQLFQAIDLSKEFRQCKQCGNWQEIHHDKDRRGSKNYCGTNCRSMFYRRKVRDAHELYKAGVSIPEIAERLDTLPETVEGWLQPSKPRQSRTGKGASR